MTQLTIVTTPTNSGDGTPLATAFNYCNSNFSELYARFQVAPPVSLIGSTGDVPGMYAVDSTYFYYCFADYDGTSTIWGQVTQVGNITVGIISSGTSNIKIADVNGNATTSIGGISNVVIVSTSGQYVAGQISATGNITGSYILGNGSQLTGLPATYSNANVATYLPIYSGNISANTISTTGNITGNYILGNGSQLTGLPALYNNSNVASFLANFGSNTISSTGNITTTANISVNNIIPTGIVNATGNVSGGNINTLGNVVSQGVVSASGNIITTGYFVGNFAGNITGNLVVNGSNTQILFNTNGNVDAVAGLTYNKGSNVLTVLGTVSGQGNVIGGNLVTTGQVSATGNITGNYILGNGSQLTGLPAVYGNSNVSSFLSAFGSNTISTTGTITSGNITGANISATGNITGVVISATGNITGGNLSGTNIVGTLTTAAQPNITSVGTLSSLTVTANIAGGNLTSDGQVSATGNIRTSAYLSVTQDINVGGDITATSYTGSSLSVSGNVTGGNLRTAGQISATGNITGSYILGNGSQLTGLVPSNTIQSGNSNVLIGSSAGNVSINVNGISPLAIFTPLGQTTTGFISATGTVTGGNLSTSGTISATGTITGGNLTTGGTITGLSTSVTGTTTAASVSGGVMTGTSISVSGSVTGGNIATAGILTVNSGSAATAIVNGAGNAVGNIGSSSNYFNSVFAQSTSALYADLAENYQADGEYTPGTVVVFGGDKEITVTNQIGDERVAGVISTNPAYLMNSGEPGLPVALRGKVPVQVVGPVTKGDSLVTSTTAGTATSVGRSREYAQAVFAKALESNNSDGTKVILAVII